MLESFVLKKLLCIPVWKDAWCWYQDCQTFRQLLLYIYILKHRVKMVVLKLKRNSKTSLMVSPNQQWKFLSHKTSLLSVFYNLSPLFVVYFLCKIYWRCFQNVGNKALLRKTFLRNKHFSSMGKWIHEIFVINK